MFRRKPESVRLTLRALAHLLAYPDANLRAQLPALAEALPAERAIPAARLAELQALCRRLAAMDAYDCEAQYVDTFDRGQRTSLYLFEHVHGDSRERGSALVDLMQTYRRAGLQFDASELPDHLAVVLEFASTQSPEDARAFLGETAHILKALFTALQQRASPYASVVAAVLELVGEAAETVQIPAEPELDDAWTESPAFDGLHLAGQQRPRRSAPPIRYIHDEEIPTSTGEQA